MMISSQASSISVHTARVASSGKLKMEQNLKKRRNRIILELKKIKKRLALKFSCSAGRQTIMWTLYMYIAEHTCLKNYSYFQIHCMWQVKPFQISCWNDQIMFINSIHLLSAMINSTIGMYTCIDIHISKLEEMLNNLRKIQFWNTLVSI